MPGLDKNLLEKILNFKFDQDVGKHWYLLVIAVLTAANRPEYIGRIYHIALLQSIVQDDSIIRETVRDHVDLLPVLEGYNEQFGKAQSDLLDKVNETILKIGAIVGIPRAINAVQTVQINTPTGLKSGALETVSRDTGFICNSELKRPDLPVEERLQRGVKHWETTYGKVAERITTNLNRGYPDLWQFIIQNVYGDVLSYTEIIDAPLTSLLMICSLIPMDVNPQLKGHLRGALNFGWEVNTVNQVRDLALNISESLRVPFQTEVAKL